MLLSRTTSEFKNLKNLLAKYPVMQSKWRLAVLFFAILLMPISLLLQPSYAQFTQDSLAIEVSKSGQVQVTEEITPRTTVSRIGIKPITSNVSNILAVDENSIFLSSSYSDGVIKIDTLGASHVTLAYSAQIVTKIMSNTWELSYSSSDIESVIILPSGSDIIYVNDIPIDINENIVTMPAGEELTIRYKIKSLTASNFVASWEDSSYVVQVLTISKIYNFNFEQSSKAIILTLDAGEPVLAIIPKSLLGGPYSVKGSNDSPIAFRHYYQNATHSWLRIEPSNSATIRIVGTTVVPEFVFFLIFPLAMAVVIFVILKQKFLLRN